MISSEKEVRAARIRAALEHVATPFVSIALAMLVGSLIIWLVGYDPGKAFLALLDGSFGGPRQIGDTMLRATPLIFTGLAVAYGFRAGLFNIGAEGQLFMGGLVAAWLGLLLAGLPPVVTIPTIIVAGMISGAAWAFVPAVLKARVGAHEVITTMMFTFIARYIVSWLVTGPLQAEGAIPQTKELPPESTLPRLVELMPFLETGRAHVGFFMALAFAVFVWWILKRTTLGFEARAVGYNPFASETSGISVSSTTVKSLCISGALASMAGVMEVIAVHGRLFDQFSAGFGFTGIAVALLARNNPLAVVAAAILFGALSAGAGTMQMQADVPPEVIFIIQALIIFFVAAQQLARWVVRPLSGKGEAKGA
ncbi:MAG: ABC transporter permease [Actinobacteria bacterium]|nr:ABC transporter permease [Actinomycetota bacterium]